MAKLAEKSIAIKMRLEGASYSQIKDSLNVSKSSLSLWLSELPLSKERMDELRGKNPLRIERFRETMYKKRESRLDRVRAMVNTEFGKLSKREIFIAGLFLYWGEGGKTERYTASISNTDPSVLRFFLAWLAVLGVPKENVRVYVHLYRDMNIEKELRYWSRVLALPRKQFRKPYIKTSSRSGLTYGQKFTHGTCNVIYHNRDIAEYVHTALGHIQAEFAPTKGI